MYNKQDRHNKKKLYLKFNVFSILRLMFEFYFKLGVWDDWSF